MKIGFVIGMPPFAEVYTLKEVLECLRVFTTGIPDTSCYYLIKALEKNKDFEQEVIRTRKKLKIPTEGYNWVDYHNMEFDAYSNPKSEEDTKKFKEWMSVIDKASLAVFKKFNLHPSLKEMLSYIIIGNFVFWLPPKIEAGPEFGEGKYPENLQAYHIAIRQKISKNELLRFIEENWSRKIEDYVKDLPAFHQLYISDRDLKIIKLRDEGKLPFSKITERILKDSHIEDPEGKINEDSIKTAYRRTKTKILALTKSKQKKHKPD